MIAMYPGTFDPLTLGHADLITRALRLFSRLVVAVAHNPSKQALFSAAERVAMIRTQVEGQAHAEVVQFDGLVIAQARRLGVDVLVRGLRPGNDFVAEYPLAVANRRQAGGVETLWMPCGEAHAAVSSRLVREIAALGGDPSPFVPPHVAQRLQEKFP
jgi:pantetheine-phosphate adenylyltransferase